jgi:predicted ester cyclase
MQWRLVALMTLLILPLGGGRSSAAEGDIPASVAAFYRALNAGADVGALIGQATAPDWASCGGNDTCRTRDETVQAISRLHQAVPDIGWEIREAVVAGDRVIVRGKATGTPAGDFLGVPNGGKSFQLMSIDVHTLAGGRIVRSYHVEDWMGASRQLSAK